MGDGVDHDFSPPEDCPQVSVALRCYRGRTFDHERDVALMPGQDVLDEYNFLQSGYADMRENRASLGLSKKLQDRKQKLAHALIEVYDEFSSEQQQAAKALKELEDTFPGT